jgi:hypothetical protein
VAPQATQLEVKHEVGNEKHITYVPRDTTIDQLTQRLAYAHKGKGIHAIASEGVVIDGSDPVEDWLQRTADIHSKLFFRRKFKLLLIVEGNRSNF